MSEDPIESEFDPTPPAPGDPRTPAENAQLALLLEVAGTPKPGNVDRRRDLDDLRFDQFLAGSVGCARGLRLAESEAAIGDAFERGVAGMSRQSGGNTQFGCLLLLVPLVRAAASGDLSRDGVRDVVEASTVSDAADFYRAFEHVDVAVDDPPSGADELDVRHGADAIPALRYRGLTLLDVMELSADPESGVADGNAIEWTTAFERTFSEAEAILDDDGPVLDRVARSFLRLLADQPDTLVAIQHGSDVAEQVSDRAAAVVGDLDAAEDLATEFVAEGINPGTTADVTCAAVYVALERGLDV